MVDISVQLEDRQLLSMCINLPLVLLWPNRMLLFCARVCCLRSSTVQAQAASKRGAAR